MKKNKKNIEFLSIVEGKDSLTIIPVEPLTYYNAKGFRAITGKLSEFENPGTIKLDFSKQTNFDTYLIVFKGIIESYCFENKLSFNIQNSNENIDSVIELLKSPAQAVPEIKSEKSVIYKHFEQVGRKVIQISQDIFNFISFFGEIFTKILKLFIHPSAMRWHDVPLHFTQSGVFALPITFMIVFLLGLITGYQGAIQLKQFGADSFISALIGISLTRELSPLMVAILVAGRSGSAFAAEIGTMKVSEEIDALTTMGFDKLEFLVLPRVFSVTLAMPFLVIICNIIGMIGGMIAAITTLDVTITGYIMQMQMALSLWDIGTGMIKSVVFGFLIASLGCYKGLNVQGGADAVGRYTTSSVVAGVFLIILTDAVFTFVFQSLGI